MLFNSYIFILIFLPITLFVYYMAYKSTYYKLATCWLVLASLFFYGWWNPIYLVLIVSSIAFNYSLGYQLGKNSQKMPLAFGIVVNLIALCYFKYANFFIDNFNHFSEQSISISEIVLPLAISFFTFQQIAYLVDAYKGITKEYSFLHYSLFVLFFPQLIAGPIVHHKDMLPQFANKNLLNNVHSNFSIGLTIFIIGLFKKVVMADGIAVYGSPIFSAAENNDALSFYDAWFGALAYTFQLYFDFSGYSDMAVGIARLFGIVLPINFFSPYKANNIIEFWRRWHISLSTFLRDYLYIPLGGNRKGKFQRHNNLMITMLLGGLWHGAGWTFVIWGGIHGSLLIINHIWQGFSAKFKPHNSPLVKSATLISARLITFICIVFAWVMFRSDSVEGAVNMYSSMLGLNGIYFPSISDLQNNGFRFLVTEMFQEVKPSSLTTSIPLMTLMFVIVWFMPNTFELVGKHNPTLGLEKFASPDSKTIRWQFSLKFAFLLAVLTFICLLKLAAPSEFLYFQF